MRIAAVTALCALACLAGAKAQAMPLCTDGKRVTCVVDGDTVWIEGEKIRLADIDAPERDARCMAELDLATRSTLKLAELLRDGGYVIRRGDPADGRTVDRFGRTLAVIEIDGKSVGAILTREGLARPWTGRRESWC